MNHVPVYFSAHEQIKTITVKTNTDTSKEDPESFILKLYRTSGDYESGLDSLAVSQGHIADKAGTIASDQSHYTYLISTKHSTKEAKFSVSDQSNITTDTTITVQKNSDNAITFTAKASGASGQEFNINTLSAKYTATNIANAINAHSDFTASTSGSVVTVAVNGGGITTLKSGDEARITATNPVKEGEDAIFTIARTLEAGKTASAQTVYLNTKSGTATKEDFQAQEKFAIHLNLMNSQKTLLLKQNRTLLLIMTSISLLIF